MKSTVSILFLILVLGHQVNSQSRPEFRFHGIRVFVADMDASIRFYEEFLGLDVTLNEEEPPSSFPIYLTKRMGTSNSNYPFDSRTGLAIQVHKLLPAIDHLRSKNVTFYDTLLQRNGVGVSIPFKDPSNNVLNLMEVQIRNIPSFDGFKVYNAGVTISDMDEVSDFYMEILGFEEWSRNYLPEALPLKHDDGTFAFMIHQKKNLKRNTLKYGDVQMILLFETPDVKRTKEYLRQKGISFDEMEERIICNDPAGNSIEILENVQ